MKYTEVQQMKKEAGGLSGFAQLLKQIFPKAVGTFSRVRHVKNIGPVGRFGRVAGSGALDLVNNLTLRPVVGSINSFYIPAKHAGATTTWTIGRGLKNTAINSGLYAGQLGLYNAAFGAPFSDKGFVGRAVAPYTWTYEHTLKPVIDAAGKKVDTVINGEGPTNLTTQQFSLGALGNLLNPFSTLASREDWVPEKVRYMFDNTPDRSDAEAQRAAHMVWKTGAIGLLAAGLVGAYRVSKHLKEMTDLKNADRPGKGLSSQLSTTFAGNLAGKKQRKKKTQPEQQKEAAQLKQAGGDNFSVPTLFSSAIPTGALLLAGTLAYGKVDDMMDEHRKKQLDKAINAKEKALKALITTRARVAKGSATDKEVNAALRPLVGEDIYVKEATINKAAAGEFMRGAVSTTGLLASAIVLASAIGSYSYFSAADENNIKYKAYKKALKEYAKNKSGMTPITVIPTDASSYFEGIDDANTVASTNPRKQPKIDTDTLNKPISVSF